MIHDLPPELHAHIAWLLHSSNTPGLRSLAETSSYFHLIAQPYLYRDVRLGGARQAGRYMETMTATPRLLQSLRSLFLSDADLQNNTHGHSETEMEKKTSHTRARELFLVLLRMAAPNLRALTVIVQQDADGSSTLARVFRMGFPKLKRLSVSGFYPFPSGTSNFPVLEWLRLSGNRNPHGLLRVGDLELAMPRLVGLRVEGLKAAVTFAIEVKEALERHRTATGAQSMEITDSQLEETSDDWDGPRLPPLLRQLVLQAEPVLRGGASTKPTSVQLKHDRMVKTLLSMRGVTEHGIEIRVPGEGDDIEIDLSEDSWLADWRRHV